MKNILFSIVVSIYNIERYIERCINSIINQTYSNLEIILIDDGSTDMSGEFCDSFAKMDNRIKVIHKKNEGLGMARNTGLNVASGEYICFFDGDDYIDLDTFNILNNYLNEKPVDITIFGWNDLNKKNVITRKVIPNANKKYFYNEEILEQILPQLIYGTSNKYNIENLMMSAWSSCYSLNLIKENDWKFTSEREVISEDVYSLLGLYKNVKSVGLINKALYFYCTNETSLTHIFRKDRFDKIKDFYYKSKSLCEANNYSEEIINRLKYPFFSFSIAALKQYILFNKDNKEKKIYLKNMLNDLTFQGCIKNINYNNSLKKRILIKNMKNKNYNFVYLLIKMNLFIDKIKKT